MFSCCLVLLRFSLFCFVLLCAALIFVLFCVHRALHSPYLSLLCIALFCFLLLYLASFRIASLCFGTEPSRVPRRTGAAQFQIQPQEPLLSKPKLGKNETNKKQGSSFLFIVLHRMGCQATFMTRTFLRLL